MFALDSIPAAFAITADPFLVFTSNVFAILGLRSLYFALAGAIEKFKYLKTSLSAILGLIGAKMLTGDFLKEHLGPNVNLYMLGVVVGDPRGRCARLGHCRASRGASAPGLERRLAETRRVHQRDDRHDEQDRDRVEQ